MTADEKFTGEPIPGADYVVLSSLGNPLKATLLQSRENPKTRQVQYFFHYENKDKRLDEWLSIDSILSMSSPALEGARRLTRGVRRNYDEESSTTSKQQPTKANSTRILDMKAETRVRNIDEVEYFDYCIKTWYYSFYPVACQRKGKLYICHRCMGYFMSYELLEVHLAVCCAPNVYKLPGHCIYGQANFQIREVRGCDEPIFCQCLCLFSKLFLEGKYLFFWLETYRFYVIYQYEKGDKVVSGFFSKDMQSATNNLACIIVFPPFQKKGYGKLLISLSYEITRLKECRLASPEKPLTDLGALLYRSYWAWKISSILVNGFQIRTNTQLKIASLALLCNITAQDTVRTLTDNEMVSEIISEQLVCLRYDDVRRVYVTMTPPSIIINADQLFMDERRDNDNEEPMDTSCDVVIDDDDNNNDEHIQDDGDVEMKDD